MPRMQLDSALEALRTHRRPDQPTCGGTIWAKPYEHYTPQQIHAEVTRSLFPTLWTCRAVLPHLIEQASGTIVNVLLGRHPRCQPCSLRGGQGRGQRDHRCTGDGSRAVRNTRRGNRSRRNRGATTRRGTRTGCRDRRGEGLVPADRRPGPSTRRYSSVTAPWTNRLLLSLSLPPKRPSYVTGTVLPVAGGRPRLNPASPDS